MISIVLVSHSRKIAQGLIDLLRQVTVPGVQIAEAAGVGLDYADLGTDAVHIAEVIRSVYSSDGVLVFMDLGSAVISAEMALDLLPEEMRVGVCFCPAAFVEGALAAGVQAGLGKDLHAICQESQKALAAKAAQLSAPAAASQSPVESSHTHEITRYEVSLYIRDAQGLHLRPAARFVQTAARFQADIKIWNQSTSRGPVSAKSITGLATLNVRQGDKIMLSASGPEAKEAIQALCALVEQNNGE